MGARDVLFGPQRIDLILDFIALTRNGQQADAVDSTSGGSEFGNPYTALIPSRVCHVHQENKANHTH